MLLTQAPSSSGRMEQVDPAGRGRAVGLMQPPWPLGRLGQMGLRKPPSCAPREAFSLGWLCPLGRMSHTQGTKTCTSSWATVGDWARKTAGARGALF